MATVLRSPIIGMNDNEMAWMMAAYKRFTERTRTEAYMQRMEAVGRVQMSGEICG